MKKIVFNIMIIITIILLLFANICFAEDISTEDYKDIYIGKSIDKVDNIVGIVLGVIQVVGSFVAMIMLIYIGIMYMKESPAGKAETKQRLYPYFIGAILLFAGSNLFQVVVNWIIKLMNES